MSRSAAGLKLSRDSSSRPVAIVASGLRSSWLASATKRRCTACPACSRASMAFIVSARRPTSSRAARHRDPHGGIAGGGDPGADGLDRPQRPPRGEVGDDAGDQHQQRDPDEHQVEDGRDGLVHVAERLCGVDGEVAALHGRAVGDDHDLLGRLGIGLLDPVAVGHPHAPDDLGVARLGQDRGHRLHRPQRVRRAEDLDVAVAVVPVVADHLDQVAALRGGVDGVLLDVVLEVRRDPLRHDLGLLRRGLLQGAAQQPVGEQDERGTGEQQHHGHRDGGRERGDRPHAQPGTQPAEGAGHVSRVSTVGQEQPEKRERILAP